MRQFHSVDRVYPCLGFPQVEAGRKASVDPVAAGSALVFYLVDLHQCNFAEPSFYLFGGRRRGEIVPL